MTQQDMFNEKTHQALTEMHKVMNQQFLVMQTMAGQIVQLQDHVNELLNQDLHNQIRDLYQQVSRLERANDRTDW